VGVWAISFFLNIKQRILLFAHPRYRWW